MEYATYGPVIDFSDKTQTFSLNSFIAKNNQFIRKIEDVDIGDLFINGETNSQKKNEFYNEDYLKKLIRQVSEALEFRKKINEL